MQFSIATEAEIRLTGSANLRLQLRLTDPSGNPLLAPADAVVFAYLDEVDTSGSVHYITETQLRVGHRMGGGHAVTGQTPLVPRPGAHDHATRSFDSQHFRPVSPGETIAVEAAFEPIAWVLASGSTLRLTLTGADEDNFLLEPLGDLAPAWRIALGPGSESSLRLPVLP